MCVQNRSKYKMYLILISKSLMVNPCKNLGVTFCKRDKLYQYFLATQHDWWVDAGGHEMHYKVTCVNFI